MLVDADVIAMPRRLDMKRSSPRAWEGKANAYGGDATEFANATKDDAADRTRRAWLLASLRTAVRMHREYDLRVTGITRKRQEMPRCGAWPPFASGSPPKAPRRPQPIREKRLGDFSPINSAAKAAPFASGNRGESHAFRKRLLLDEDRRRLLEGRRLQRA